MYGLCDYSKASYNQNIPKPDFKALQKKSNFTKAELNKIFIRFSTLAEKEGHLRKAIFFVQPECVHNKILGLAFDYESRAANDKVQFEHFVCVIAALSNV